MVAFFLIVLTGLLAWLSWIDIRTFRLPNPLTLALIILGLIQAIVLRQDWLTGLLGVFGGYLAFVSIEIGFKRLRGIDGLGRGDAKLLAAGGAWCGWVGLPFIVLIASVSALLAVAFPRCRNSLDQGRLPFGPFLSVGVLSVWIYQNFFGSLF